jgi:acyl-CoA synthetase (AMP-forming)/AMP-acid ligase II
VVARYQKLSQVYIIEAMPRNVAGKTLKQELRVRFATS